MLPDFPHIKRRAAKAFNRFLQQEVYRRAPLLAEIPRAKVHEGHDWNLTPIGADSPPTNQGFERFEVGMTVPTAVMKRGAVGAVLEIYSNVAEELAEAQSKLLFERVSDAANRAGNVVNSQGAFSQEAFLELVERVQADFDPKTGEETGQFLVMHPDLAESMLPKLEEWDQDPDFKAQLNEIRDRKREDWRDRELNRRLVD